MTINSRKDNHIAVCLKKNVQSESTNGFEKYRLVHNALPERNFEDIKTETVFLNQKIAAPILISSITGGTESGNRINRSLLEAANTLNIPFAMGSMRILLEEDSHGICDNPRKYAPSIPVLANIGAVQFNYGFSRDQCLRAIELIEANALILHLNPLQEVLQSSKNTNFSGLLKKIDHLCSNFPVPIIVKEVGWGISDVVAKNLIDAGVQIIDVAGAGGTSWAKVEAEISGTETAEQLASPFFSWGIPTAQCIEQIHARFPNISLIASGGITHGVDIWKALLLGAKMIGIAGPLLAPANEGPQAVVSFLEILVQQLRIAKFLSQTIVKEKDYD